MGGWEFVLFFITQIGLNAMEIGENGQKKFIIHPEPVENLPRTNDFKNPLSSSFYAFHAENEDGSHVDINPNFNYEIQHPGDPEEFDNNPPNILNNDENPFIKKNVLNGNSVISNVEPYGSSFSSFMVMPHEIPSNSKFLSYTLEYPRKATKVNAEEYNKELHRRNKHTPTVRNNLHIGYSQQKYITLSPKHTITDIVPKATNSHRTLRSFYRPSFNVDHDQFSNLHQEFTSSMEDLIRKAHFQYAEPNAKYTINREDFNSDPNQHYEIVEGNHFDDHSEGSTSELYKEKKKKKEIHYHQHKHLHEHDHDQKHSHKHKDGHHHDHGHDHSQKHAHSHSHKNHHSHDHHMKHHHDHKADHHHDHHSDHDHKHHQDHKHKHGHDHDHGHHSKHHHSESHLNDHSHKHHADHDHHHGEDEKHKHDHGHKHSHKHGHKH